MNFLGKVIVKSTIEVKTGMRIGGSTGGLKIGGLDLNVITDPFGKPYIPGSSLKGKMRTLIERKEGVVFNKLDRNRKPYKHECEDDASYERCPVCKVWGLMGGTQFTVPTLTRIIVCDAYLDEPSITQEVKDNLELEWTEVKFETAINRLTGTALHGSLRQAERVPAGAKFRDSEIILSILEEDDKKLLKKVFEAMELLEQDYLGGMGSRGYGRVAFRDMEIYWNKKDNYESGDIDLKPERKINNGFDTPSQLVANFGEVKAKLT